MDLASRIQERVARRPPRSRPLPSPRADTLARTLRTLLTHHRLPLAVAVLAVLLSLPALASGWWMDDYYHRAAFLHPAALRRVSGVIPRATPAGLFDFVDGDPRHVRQAVAMGIFPWWTDPELRARFFRPLAGLTHWLDYQLWPNSAPLMHAQSLFWFGALVLVVALFYRRILGRSATAGLAALLFAVDSAHGMPAGWIANRNILLAAFFGVLAMGAYDRWRRDRWRFGALAAPLLLALSLLSAEAGVATLAYLLAYAAFLDPAPWRSRLRALLPSLAVVIGWRVLSAARGVGTRGMGLYADPGAGVLHFFTAVVQRAPLMLLGQWSPIPAEIGHVLTARNYAVLWSLSVVFLAVLAFCMLPLIRRDTVARYFAAGMLLSVVPMCAAFPDDRLLVFVGVGAMGLLAQFLTATLARPSAASAKLWRRAVFIPVAFALVVVHLGLSPLLLPLQAESWGKEFAPMYADLSFDPSIADQSLILVNGPLAFLPGYMPMMRAVAGRPVPRYTRVLSPSCAAVQIRRPDERTLILTPRGGYLARPVDTLFRSPHRPLRRGERQVLPEVTIEVLSLTGDGRPASIACRFRAPLEDASLRWLSWRGGRYGPFRPPAVGAETDLPPALPRG